MRKSKNFITLPVISIEDGQQLGYVKDLVINPIKTEISGLIVEQKGWFKEQKIIPYNKVQYIGDDALTIEKSSNVEKPANLPEIISLIKERNLIISSKVITETGLFLGFVNEFFVDETTGKITALEIKGPLINNLLHGHANMDIGYIRTIGHDILIAYENAQEGLNSVDDGLHNSINTLKETSNQLLHSTVKKTKKIGLKIKAYASRSPKESADDTPEASENDEILPPNNQ